MDLLSLFVATLGGSGAALLVAAWLSRRWIHHQLDKALEDYKTGLVQKTETLKTELSIYAHEQNVGLSRIDAQRAEAIEAIWKTYCEWHEHMIAVVAPNRPRGPALAAADYYRHHSVEMMKKAEEMAMQARDFAIYFDQQTYEAIAACGKALADETANYYAASFEGVRYQTEQEALAHLAVVDTARHSFRETTGKAIGDLRSALLKAMRRLMKAERNG